MSFEGFKSRDINDVESALRFYIERAMNQNSVVGIEGFTGNETELTWEGVKGTFPDLTQEQAEEVATKFNEMIGKGSRQENIVPDVSEEKVEKGIVGTVEIADVDAEVKHFVDRALRMNRENGIEGLTGNETELIWESVKSTFPNLTVEQAKEVAQRYNRMIEIVKETKGADAFAKECTAEEVKGAGNTLESTPEIADHQSELEK